MFKVPEKYRVKSGVNPQLCTTEKNGNNGVFMIVYAGRKFFCIASDGMGWDHVSVSLKNRCPTWEEMCFIKNIFWSDDDCVMQYHPAKSDYVNNHPYCLHLWRPQNADFPIPKKIMV